MIIFKINYSSDKIVRELIKREIKIKEETDTLKLF